MSWKRIRASSILCCGCIKSNKNGPQVSEQEGMAYGQPPQHRECVESRAKARSRAEKARGAPQADPRGARACRVPPASGTSRPYFVIFISPFFSVLLLGFFPFSFPFLIRASVLEFFLINTVESCFGSGQERLEFLYDSGLAVGKSSGFKALESVPKVEPNAAASSSTSAKVIYSIRNLESPLFFIY